MHSRGPSDDGGDRGITFPMFLTMMGEHLYDFDAETELLAAFECFDESDSGFVKCVRCFCFFDAVSSSFVTSPDAFRNGKGSGDPRPRTAPRCGEQ